MFFEKPKIKVSLQSKKLFVISNKKAMEQIMRELRDFLQNTPKEQISEVWESVSKYDKFEGPTMKEFLEWCMFQIRYSPPKEQFYNFENENPNFNSDFFYVCNYESR